MEAPKAPTIYIQIRHWWGPDSHHCVAIFGSTRFMASPCVVVIDLEKCTTTNWTQEGDKEVGDYLYCE